VTVYFTSKYMYAENGLQTKPAKRGEIEKEREGEDEDKDDDSDDAEVKDSRPTNSTNESR
jgi:hypothetical protein